MTSSISGSFSLSKRQRHSLQDQGPPDPANSRLAYLCDQDVWVSMCNSRPEQGPDCAVLCCTVLCYACACLSPSSQKVYVIQHLSHPSLAALSPFHHPIRHQFSSHLFTFVEVASNYTPTHLLTNNTVLPVIPHTLGYQQTAFPLLPLPQAPTQTIHLWPSTF